MRKYDDSFENSTLKNLTCGVSAAAGTGQEGNFSCPGPYLMDLRLEESLTGGAGGGESSSLVGGAVLTGAKFSPDWF